MASNSSSMIKQLLNLKWLSQNVVFLSVLHIIMWTIIMYNHLRTWKIVPFSSHTSVITCIITSACFFSHIRKVEKMCWAEVKHSHSNTMTSISFKVNPMVESIPPNLLRLPPRCNQYCLRNSVILSSCRVETVLTLLVGGIPWTLPKSPSSLSAAIQLLKECSIIDQMRQRSFYLGV